MEILRLRDRVGGSVERVGPGDHFAGGALTDLRLEQTALRVHPLEAVATLVAQPTVVHGLRVDAEQAHETVRRRLHRAAALHRARRARRLDGREVPGPCPEAILARGERTYRADLHGVAREVRVERLLFEVQDLHAIAAVDEVDERVAGDLVGEADAPRALDTALAVEQHKLAQRDRLGEVALLLDEPRLTGPECERLVLQRALAAPVAHRAVEGVVDEQELEDSVLDLLHRLVLRVHHHAVGDGRRAGRWIAAAALDLDEAHPTHADRLHALVPTEPRDVDTVLLRGLDQELARLRFERDAVDGDRRGRLLRLRRVRFGGRHACTPASLRRRSSTSSRKNLFTLAIQLTDDGPSGQIVVCTNGAFDTPGEMLPPTETSRSRSSGRP